MVNNDDDNSPTFHPTYRNTPSRGGRGRGRGKRARGYARGNKRTSLIPNESPSKMENIIWSTPERVKGPINRRKSRGGIGGSSRLTSTPLQVFEEDTRMSADLGPFHMGK